MKHTRGADPSVSSESAGYLATMLVGGLAMGLALGVPLAWVIAAMAGPRAGARARVAWLVVGTALLVMAALMWRFAIGTFLATAMALGLGVGFLVQAARPRAGTGA